MQGLAPTILHFDLSFFLQLATFCASENGLKVTVEDAKCVQANAFIQSNIFQEYYMQEDTATFKINLSVLLVCFSAFPLSSTSRDHYIFFYYFFFNFIFQSDFPKDSDMVESFQCTQTQSVRYKLCLLKPSIKALMQSSKVSIRTDNRGFLSLQYMIRNEDGQISFVEYYCAPDEEYDEDG
nr:cell cycle checkpoint protein RAD1-like [Lytechinus pictus]